MAKIWIVASLASFVLVLNGCGGSSSSTEIVGPGGGTTAPQYKATLPDGSTMDIEIVDESNGNISGSFAVAAITGPYAFQAGELSGSVSANMVSMDCDMSDGTEFQMTGKQVSNGFELTRSDIPGIMLNFTLEAPSPSFSPLTTSSYSTNMMLGSGGTNAKMTIGSSPFSVQGGGVLTEYRGTYAGVPVTFWQYNTGQANIVTNLDPLSLDSSMFSNLKLTDLATVSATSSTASLTTYSNTTKSTFRTRHVVTLAP